MTRPSLLRTFIFLFVVTIGLTLSDRYFFDQKMIHFGPLVIKNPASYVFTKLEGASFFLQGFVRVRSIILESENLKKENLNLLSKIADHDDLKSENDFLRKALKISPRFNNEVISASIYHFQLGLDGYDILLNKGVGNGISDGDTVITEEGVLVGKIEKTYNYFSRVLVVNDGNFSMAAKVLNSPTAGIARGAFFQGLYFDLIVQNDPIKEGDTVVSSGLDLIPPALIVGVVSYVETDEANLFKKVKIRPAMGEMKIGRVLVIKTRH